jgi:hypothetical protein
MQRLPKVCVGVALAAGLLGTHLYLAAQNSATSGEFQVTDAGAASYTVPIYAAPGTGNLDVKLALQYNSQSSNGVFGQGWSLTGVSAITRCPKTHAEEGDRVGVKNDATDVFCLDGQKLRSVSGVYGAAGTVYRTARESYSQITSNGVQGTGPQNFVVQTKSGLVMQFGATLDSRLEHPTTGTARVWMVNQIKDRFGNPINFTYNKSTALGEQLLQTVRYSNGQVKLVYEARPANDKIIKFDNGVQLGSTDSRVSKIEIYEEPVVSGARVLRLFKDYRMTYVQSGATRRSLLTNIQECAANGNCLPRMTMAYQNTQALTMVAGAAAPGVGNGSDLITDVEGKGIQRAVQGPPSANNRVIAWDIDGDSRTDFTFFTTNDFTGDKEVIQYATGLTSITPWIPPGGTACYADLNGDGISERLTFVGTGFDTQYTEIQESLTGTGGGIINGILPSSTCQAIDIDGDGRAEVYVKNASALYTYQNNRLLGISSQLGGVFGDFNGDGKTDALAGANGAYNFFLASGTSTSWTPGATLTQSDPAASLDISCTGDFNGDGRTDFYLAQSRTLMLSNGNSFTPLVTNMPASSFAACGDFNGDGLTDIAVNGQYYWSSTPGAVDVLKEVNNGLGHIHKVEYKSITDDTIYTKLSGAAYPQVDLQTPIQVVVRAQSGNDSQGYSATTYRYEGLRADLKRRGTLGFQKVTSRSETTGISVATTYHQADPLIGLKQRTRKYAGTASSPQILEDISYDYGPRGLAGAGSASSAQYAQVPVVGMTTLRNELGSGAFIAAMSDSFDSIDAYGNVLIHSMLQFDNGNIAISGKTTTNEYTVDTGRWLVGQLTKSTVRSRNLRTLPATTVGTAAGAGSQTGIPGLTVSASPNPIAVQRNNPGAVTAAVSAQVSGGVPAYTYLWSVPSGSRITVSSPSSAATNLNANLTWGETVNEVAQLKVTDQAGVIRTINVNVQMVVPAALSITLSSNALTASRQDPGNLSVSTSLSAAGGTGGYTYNWIKLNGSRISIANAATANPIFSASMNWSENFTEGARVTVTDSAGNSLVRDITINLSTPAPPPLVSSISPSSITALRFNPGTLSASAAAIPSGGTGGYICNWAKLNGARISLSNATSCGSPSFSAYMNWGENFTENARVTITDSAGSITATDLAINFSTPPQLISSINPSSFTLSRNNPGPLSRAVTASVSGGNGFYTYGWTKLSGSRVSIINPSSASPTFYADVGWGESFTESARLTVTDTPGNVTYSDISMSFTTPAALIASFNPAVPVMPYTCQGPGYSLNLSVSASGGVPGYTYSWSASNGLSITSQSGSTAVIGREYLRLDGLAGDVNVAVQDAAGNVVNRSATLANAQTGFCPGDGSNRVAPPTTTTPKQ